MTDASPPAPTTLVALASQTRLLVWEHPPSMGVQYSYAGTGFLVRIRGARFLVTAAHCVPQRAWSDENRLVVGVEGTHLFEVIPFMAVVWALPAERTDDQERFDICVFVAAEPEITSSMAGAFDLLDLDRFREQPGDARSGVDLFVAGYPCDLNRIDYDGRVIRAQRVGLAARYVGPFDVAAGCHELVITDLLGLTSLQGMSGSPVFGFERITPDAGRAWLAGMLVRGSAESKRGYFVGTDSIRALCLKALDAPEVRRHLVGRPE